MPSVVIGYEDLDITCRPHPSWTIQSITRIQLYKDTRGTIGSPLSELVFMYLDLTFLKEEFQWSDLSVKERGEATGALSPTVDSFLRLIIPANTTLCEDAANYRCEISGTNFGAPSSRLLDFSVTGLGKADQIYGLDVVLQSGFSSATGRYDYNSVLVVTCNATIGLPPLDMHWCAKTSNMSDLSPFPNADQISTSGVMADGACQNRQESTLVYHVTEVDMGTQIMCEVTNVSDCVTNQLNASYSFDVVFGRVNMNATTNITLRQDDVEVFCYQATTGEGLKSVDRMEIFRDNTSVVSAVLENGNTAIEWWDNSLEGRSLLTADITMPSSAFIKLTIPANASECSDIAAYRCQLTATSVAETVVNDYMDISIYSETLPEDISPLRIQDSAGDSVPPGGAVQVGETITIVCNGTVGRPAQSMRWCIRKYGGIFVNYPHNDDVITSDVNVADACQNFMNSTLTYDVTSGDIETTFMCEIGGEVCGDGILASEVSIYAVDIAIRSRVPEEIYAGVDDLLIRCSQTAAGIGLLRDPEIRLYRNSSVINDTAVLSLTFDKATNQSTITWFDEDFEARAAAFGDVSDLTSAYLNVSVNANNVTCNDGGNYKCVLNGYIGNGVFSDEDADFLDVKVRPEHMAEIIVKTNTNETTDQRAFPVGSQLTLTCNSTIGIPPLVLFWCVRRESDDKFILIGQETSSGPVISGSCQNRQTSDINLNVTGMDRDTLVQCEVGNVSICNSGIVARRTRIHAVDLALTTYVTSTVSSGDSLNITCYQSASGLGKFRNTGIMLYRNTSDAISATDDPVVSLEINSTTNISTIIWYDDTVENRATIDGDVMDPESAYLSLVINNVTCLDGGFYWFEMTGVTPTDDWHTRGNTTQIHIDVKPDDMETIYGVVDGRHVTGRTSLSVGTSLMLSCNATVGNPPVDLHWCVRRVNNKEFIRYTGLGIQQEATFVGPCQYTRTSDVYINVTSEDAQTIFMCEAGNDWTCDGGYINEVFELFAVSADLTMDATTYVTSGQDSLSIVCMLSGEILGDIQDLIFILSRAPISGNITALQMIVSVTYNSSTNQSDITWFDLSTQQRASVHGSVVDMVTAYINLTIDKAEVTCSDSGLYSCELVGVSPTYERFMWREEAGVKVYVKPASISDVIAQTDTGLYSKEGVFPVGTGATLFCNSTVGDPPLGLHWCVRKEGQFPVVYEGFSNDTGPDPIGECQFTRSSSLLYTVKSKDTQTDFICVVGSNGTCGLGHLSSAFTLYAAVISVNAESTPLATSGLDNITVTCSVSGLRLLYDWMFSIYHNTSRDTEEEIIIISLLHAGKTNSTDVVWREPELQTRADYSIVLTDIDTMKLELSFQGEFVTCIDSGLYRCEISGNTSSGGTEKQDNTTSVTVIVLPDKIEEVNGKGDAIQANSGGIFTVNSSLVLTCNSSLGNPPMNMHWCTKMYNESHWIPYPNTSHINQTYSLSDSCNYWSISTLTSEVKDTDISTLYRCEVGDNSTCGQSVLNSTFSVYGVDVDMVIQGTKSVIGGIDDLLITCSQNATGIGLIENTSMVIYHQPQGSQWYLLVTLTNNVSSGNDVITWHNTGVDELWSANGSLAPLVTSYLQLTLKHANCRNGGAYECVLQGQVGVYGFTKKDRLDVEVQALPDRIEPIEGQLDGSVLAVEGTFPVSRTVSITCNSTVGNPPLNLFWRFKRVNDTDYTFINGSDLLELAGTGSCQLRRISQLLWTVTSADEKTVFNCIVGPTPNSAYLNATFTIIAIPCDGDCSIPEPSTPSEGVTSAVIVASVVAPLLLLLLLIGLFGFWKFPGFRTLLFKRKYFGPKVKPQDFGRDTALDLNGVGTSAPPTGTSAPPTGTSLVNGSVK